MKTIQIHKNTTLYRFVALPPNKVTNTFYESNETARFMGVNCFCLSIDDLRLELGIDKALQGSLLSAIVQVPLTIVYPTQEYEFNTIRAINDNNEHNTDLIKKVGYELPYYHISDYEITQRIANKLEQYEEIDGIGYSSAQGLNLVQTGVLFYTGMTNSISPYIQNIGINKRGFNKLKVQSPVPFWINNIH